MELKLGTIQITSTKDTQASPLSMLIWGAPGDGKTTLASTAPGIKLWLNFDPQGTDSLRGRDDILVADFSKENPNCIVKFNNVNPAGLQGVLTSNPKIETIVVDSISTYADMALAYGVTEIKNASIEAPSKNGYGRRTSYVDQMVTNVLKLALKNGKHIIFTCHEEVQQSDEDSPPVVTAMLGGKTKALVPLKLSEVWHLGSKANNRVITVRSSYLLKPMKTRMFKTSGADKFVWKYDADTGKGEGIKDWYELYKKTNAKLELPK